MSKVIQTDVGFAFQRSVIARKNRTILSTNQMQNKNQSRLGHQRFSCAFKSTNSSNNFLGIKGSYKRLFLIRSPYLVLFNC